MNPMLRYSGMGIRRMLRHGKCTQRFWEEAVTTLQRYARALSRNVYAYYVFFWIFIPRSSQLQALRFSTPHAWNGDFKYFTLGSSNFTKIIQKIAELWLKLSERSSVNFRAAMFTYVGFKFHQISSNFINVMLFIMVCCWSVPGLCSGNQNQGTDQGILQKRGYRSVKSSALRSRSW